ncbi:MAG: hypothetical protein A3E60_00400 [Candidatus Kerfeldbacteria bacterium RIFCSPHIGHO2_12_FULL_42_13]|uniref:Histidine kinase N-terminal 7TM region domain-containing protein n=1 Tax=Candidatus Daviesbacteria bacterium RIFCSPLOWO2_02_FULL_38_15 TaxID=1797794 RepID=A0A1F5N528_9BACT|nr:MAG: hypothetical protein A3H40_02660 [Candidatus Daviesbacteria bacterium RIFCSPLOWO2_02_FULL_38_15]OGY82383.1 MAG: hypothetical protein A3E60_00400 [Candidatus Kerfeldbacteria bacterium RIFCSPHIGHO2_12_FULL_42_13]
MEFITTTLINPILGIIALLNTIPGLLAYTKKEKNQYHMYFLALNVSLVGWSIAVVLLNIYKSLLFAELTFVTVACIALFFLWFSYYFAQNKILTKKIQIMTALIPCAIIFASFNKLIFTEIQPLEIAFRGEKGPLYLFFIIFLGIYFIWGFYNIISALPRCSILQRKQMLFFLLGWLVALGTTFTTNLILPLFGEYKGVMFGPLFSTSIVIYTTYAILRFRFMDISIVIKRSAIIIFLFSIVLVSLSVLAIIIAKMENQDILLIPAFSILFLFAHAIQSTIERYVKRIFPDEVINLPEFFEMMQYKIDNTSLEEFCQKLVTVVKKEYNYELKIFLKDEEGSAFYQLKNNKKK